MPNPRPRTMASTGSDDEAPVSDSTEDEAPPVLRPIRSGWSAGQGEMDKGSTWAQALILTSTTQVVRFLEDQPYASYRRHWIDRKTPQGIKKRTYTCLDSVGSKCPLCDVGDTPQAVSSFNVALIGDDGTVSLKTWDVGARLFRQIKGFADDPKFAPLVKCYYAVNKTGSGGSTSFNVIPVREHSLLEDYGIAPPTAAEFEAVGLYDPSIIHIPKRSEMEEIALEIQDYE